MQDISGYNIQAQVIASNTFPIGFTVNEFADDADPVDIPSLTVAETAMGVNGDLIAWAKANPIIVTLNVIPGSDADIALGVLLEANRVGRGKLGARDEITMNILYPGGRFVNLSPGRITEGMPGNSVSSEGRQKSKSYVFAFENKVGV